MLFEAHCKTGKLKVTDDGTLCLFRAFSKTPSWQVPFDQITRFTTQQAGLGLTILIHTSQGMYTIETFTKANFEKLHALFPSAPVQTHTYATKWYQDITKRAYAATYTKEKDMQREVEESAKHGWIPQTSAGIGGHINVGRTATAAALTGGASLLFGASRSEDKTTIAYIRTPDWLASYT